MLRGVSGFARDRESANMPGFVLVTACVVDAINDTSNWVGGFMKVLLIVFLLGLALVEYFYHYAANVQSASSADVTPQEKSEGVRHPPRQDHQGH